VTVDPTAERDFVFEPTPAVAESRSRSRYVMCSVCRADNSQYLFHKVGVRFVRCRTCRMVYVNPVGDARVNFFDAGRLGQFASDTDRRLADANFERFLATLESHYTRVEGRPLESTLLLGRHLTEWASSDTARRVGLEIATVDDAEFASLALEGDLGWAKRQLERGPQIVILSELLEACSNPTPVLQTLVSTLPDSSWLVVVYSNAESLPARTLARHWPAFFNYKINFYNQGNLTALMARFGMVITKQFPFPVTQTLGYVLRRLAPDARLTRLSLATPLASLAAPMRTGQHVAAFRHKSSEAVEKEKLSIVFPVYNEVRYAGQVIDAILDKDLAIDKELIIVESNSTDGTREVVIQYEGRDGVRVLYEEKARGKGAAVKTGLAAVTGSIILIQDADFEYDIDDYDALLEPILQRRATFVLGSRSLGLDDWKVRRYANSAIKGFLLNFAQFIFAKTFNFLYQQRVTDVNTMFKVFRSECLDGLELECDGFNLDIELASKLVLAGHAPMEVPVNYVSRGFDEGKKISFVRDALPSYWAFFRYRFR
jgi:Glycosyl transferase family 2/Methyltransferase domain